MRNDLPGIHKRNPANRRQVREGRMKECIGIFGKLFGHKFQGFYSEKREPGKVNIDGANYDEAVAIIEANTTVTKTLERRNALGAGLPQREYIKYLDNVYEPLSEFDSEGKEEAQPHVDRIKTAEQALTQSRGTTAASMEGK